MEIEWIHIVALFVVGGIASAINVVAGGGSYLTIPLLIFTGLSPGMANGTNRVGILSGNLFGSIKFARLGQLRWSDLLYYCLPATLGGVLGAHIATLVDDRHLRVILAILMLFGSWTVVRRPPSSKDFQAWNHNWCYPLFFAVGIYGGFIQAGTGFFTLAATGLLGHDLKRGNAIKTVMNLCFTVPALYIFWARGMVDWPSGLALAVGMALGGLIGVRISETSSPEKLKTMIAFAIIVSAVFILYPLIRG